MTKYIYFMRDEADDDNGDFRVFNTKKEAVDWNDWQFPRRDDGKMYVVYQAVYEFPMECSDCHNNKSLLEQRLRECGELHPEEDFDMQQFLVSWKEKTVEGDL